MFRAEFPSRLDLEIAQSLNYLLVCDIRQQYLNVLLCETIRLTNTQTTPLRKIRFGFNEYSNCSIV